MDTHYVYVLYCTRFDRLYIGMTRNLGERFLSHNYLSTNGYTYRYRPWLLVHLEKFGKKSEAKGREMDLKGGQGRQWIREELLDKRYGLVSA